ncbi:MAG: class I SAM-dependent methyltransferase, partial [Ignavibacteria bacterium]
MEWFEAWFNSKDYLKVYRHRDEEEAANLAGLILDNIKIKSGKKVLDMATGSGRHAIYFAKEGFEVTAVDLSKYLLSVAKKKANKNNLNIHFVHSDIRQFEVNTKFNLILNLFTSIGYFENDEENYSVLEN